MNGRAGLLAIVLAGALLLGPTSPRAADEPVATAPIPPLPDAPAVVPLAQRPAVIPAKPAPKTAAKPAGPAATREREHASADHRKPAVHDPAKSSKRAEQDRSRRRELERRPERRQAAASRGQPDDRPRRYYREDVMTGPGGPPFPPPWYDRGPPFAAMPYPRGPLPPW